MKLVYESPEMEVVKFSLNTSIFAASNSGTEVTVGGGDEESGDWNPF